MESAGRTYDGPKGVTSEGMGFPRAGSTNVIIVKNNRQRMVMSDNRYT